MKKQISIALALMMAASMSSFAMAEEGAGSTVDNPVVFNYADIDESVYEGAWIETGLGFDVYLPADWTISEITDEIAQQGIAFVAGEDEENGGANMVISYTEIPAEAGDYDLEQLGTELAGTYEEVLFADLNGIPAVVFSSDENEIAGYAFLTDDNHLVTGVISSSPEIGYEDYAPYFQNMTISVSPTEEASTEADTEA